MSRNDDNDHDSQLINADKCPFIVTMATNRRLYSKHWTEDNAQVNQVDTIK